MPRKRPRNPLKRQHPDFDAPPTININVAGTGKGKKNKAKKVKVTEATSLDDMSGGDTPKGFDRVINWQKYAQMDVNNAKAEKEAEMKKRKELKRRKDESVAEHQKRVSDVVAQHKGKKQQANETTIKPGPVKNKAQANKTANKRGQSNNESEDDDEDAENEKWRKASRRDTSPDPWAHLETSKPKFGDVVDRPPELNLPTKLLRNVPKAAGSLARRDMLEQERNRVVESYRRLMEQKRGNID